jgi:competence protein ComEC
MDDIQRKLALIDREHVGARDHHKQIVSTSPLVFVTVGLIIGILMQDILAWPIKSWLMLLVLCAISTIILFAVRKESYPPYVTAYLALICFICLGAIRLNSFYQPRPDDIRNFVADERKLATIRGLIITDPYINENRQWRFARFTYNDPDTSFYLKLKQVQTISGWDKVHGTIRVQVGEPVLDLRAGDSIQAYCWLDRFKGVTNLGQFNIAKYLARRNIFVAASIESRDSITLAEKHSINHLTGLKRKLREITTQALLGDIQPDSPSQGLLQALLLGYRSNIDNATYEAFRKTGLLHFISLSGLHLGILIGIIWWLCKTAGLMKRTRAVICIIAIGVFLLIVPPRAPTLRAAIIAFVFCISFFFRRRPNSLNSLSLAAVILLLIRPTQLFEVGWQLSFASVLGIILLADRIHLFIYEKITENSWFREIPKTKPFYRITTKPGPYVPRLFSIGLAAWVGSAGILLYHFYTITPLASIWTILVFPLVGAILALGFLKIILFFVLPTLSSILGVIVTMLSNCLIWIVKLIANLGISQILIGHVSPIPVILYYSFVLFAAFVYFRHLLLKKAVCTLMALAIIVFLGVTKWQRTYRDNLILNCLDVGHGQAILAQLPGKVNVLFDAGSMHKNDIGRRIVGPFLDYSGISKNEAIIISHNDIDHINGIPEVVEHCDVNGVYANEAFLNHPDTWGTVEDINDCLHANGLEMQPLSNILNLGSGANITILWPSEQVCQNEELGDNDKSVVSLIEFAGRKVLLCSDIEQFAQQELIRLFPNLKADIVVVPHHGLSSSLEPGFLESLNADVLICSCGRSQYERINPANRIGTSNFNKTKSFYTAQNGAINVSINKYGTIKTSTFVENGQ